MSGRMVNGAAPTKRHPVAGTTECLTAPSEATGKWAFVSVSLPARIRALNRQTHCGGDA